MKNTLLVLALSATFMVGCGGKKEGESSSATSTPVTKEQFIGKGRTCWNSTAGPQMFGAKICFNSNGTVNMGEGFGPFEVSNDTLILKDNNGAVIGQGVSMKFAIKEVSETKFILLSNGQEMVFNKE